MASHPFGRVCRTCLKHPRNMQKLSNLLENGTKIEDILKQTIPNFELKVQGMPQPEEICKTCLNKLKKSYDFVQICQNSNKELENIWKLQEQERSQENITEDVPDVKVKEELSRTSNKGPTKDIEKPNESDAEDNSSSEYSWPILEEYGVESSCTDISSTQASEDTKLEIENSNENEDTSSSEDSWAFQDKNNSESSSENDTTASPPTKKTLLTKHLANEFACHMCSYRFSTERKLMNHLIWIHKFKASNLHKGHYDCEYCSFKFYEKMEWANHDCMKIKGNRKLCSFYFDAWPRKNQFNEGPFICKYCSLKFYEKSDLYDHGCYMKAKKQKRRL
ncbi:uncharacterized protein LOC119606994 isoform X3 [Lucilia sericata]|uniref:uncharacterized protein LOC119606994 isoform X3 n=1 Tax=Lucilia sericata TaxID=13632 RepID=UPI0018A807F3|nr:uncharacterized protein LOC119606994 isoform X3 [Lucilia sericata]